VFNRGKQSRTLDLLGPAGRAKRDLALSEALGARLGRLSTQAAVAALRENGVPVAVPVPRNNATFMRDRENIRSRRVAVLPDPECVNIRTARRHCWASTALRC
jgi:hypothetical protein